MTLLLTAVLLVLPNPHLENLDPWLANQLDERQVETIVISPSVERWRGLVQAHFGEETTDAALRVIQCESKGNPDAYNSSSGASGLFQHLQRYWAGRVEAAGWGSSVSPFDPPANIAVAAWLSDKGTDWSHWVCKP